MRNREDGVALLEVLVAAFLIGLALVPLLQLYPRTVGYTVSNLNTLLSAAAIRKAEEIITRMRPSGTSSTAVLSGTAACTDVPNCLLVWTITTEASSTQGGWLNDVSVVACQDTDLNNICEAGEPQVRYDTKGTSRP